MFNCSNYSNQIPNLKSKILGIFNKWDLFRSIRIIKLIRIFVLFTICYLLFAIKPKTVEAAASLSLSPATKTVEVNQEFEVEVILNTGGANTDAADVILNYDSEKLSVVTAILGNLYDTRLVANTSVSGRITLRASASAGNYFNGTGTFATITFKGKAVGTGLVSFDFSANSTTDCNVAYAGSDILGSVSNGTYTVVAAGTLPTSTSGPTGTITPRPTQPVTGRLAPTVIVGLFGTFLLVLGSLVFLF